MRWRSPRPGSRRCTAGCSGPTRAAATRGRAGSVRSSVGRCGRCTPTARSSSPVADSPSGPSRCPTAGAASKRMSCADAWRTGSRAGSWSPTRSRPCGGSWTIPSGSACPGAPPSCSVPERRWARCAPSCAGVPTSPRSTCPARRGGSASSAMPASGPGASSCRCPSPSRDQSRDRSMDRSRGRSWRQGPGPAAVWPPTWRASRSRISRSGRVSICSTTCPRSRRGSPT